MLKLQDSLRCLQEVDPDSKPVVELRLFIEEKKRLRLLEKPGWQQIKTHSVELGKKRRALQTSLGKMANLEEVLSDTSQHEKSFKVLWRVILLI